MPSRTQHHRFLGKTNTVLASAVIPEKQWESFVEDFGRSHQGCVMALETTDLETGETAVSLNMRLQSMDFDLEDEKNPRINVTATVDNKTFKHVLFQPSHVALLSSRSGETLDVETVNTRTQVHFRPGAEILPSITRKK